MDAGSPASGGFSEALAASIRAQPDLAWLTPLRSEALRRFDSAGFPSTRLEDWRYTDLGEYARRSREITAGVAATAAGATPALAGRLVPAGMGLVAVFRSGVLDAGLSQPAALAGLTCTRLAAGAGRAAWLDSLGADSHEGADPLAALNAALLRDGLALEVAAGARVERPLYVAHVSEPDRTAHNRLVLHLAPGSACTLIEHQLGQGSGTANSVTDISCGRDARLTYIRLQDEPATALHVAQQRIRLEAGAEA
ncbi:MAG: SufD family Fe-S cluster assembly protein, partial [Gammaproteobacteria bacterium]|nr:SufD family Fe-S cluster assembly protein [Gammaproteobacteria bacterium]